MQNTGINPSRFDLSNHGLDPLKTVYWNLSPARLVEEALLRGEGQLAANGSLVVRTGPYTGRSPKDRYIVRDEITQQTVDWGDVNFAMAPKPFDRLYERTIQYLQQHDVFVQDCFAGADPDYALPIRTITELAWHSLFARQLFIFPGAGSSVDHVPKFTILYAPGVQADPTADGTRSEAFVALNFTRKVVIIGGTQYAGEMKKSVFGILNYLLPERGVFPMHCSANVGKRGDVALFFGLSGTGKTTLSADPTRCLIGDDEHGWSDNGVFNFEGGCYAKCICLSKEKEPQIWHALRFGSALENVVCDPETRQIDFDDSSITENTRAIYPVDFIGNAATPSVGSHPSDIVFLTTDAFGVLPPISRLTPAQAMYHFLSGYTAKVAGTERGLGQEPAAVFSACFGAPFLPRSASSYTEMLGVKLRKHQARCWLVNTGWTGGAYGIGKRIDLPYTRAMLTAALSGELAKTDFEPHTNFGVAVPKSCSGVPNKVLDARGMWKDKAAYDQATRELARRFQQNFQRFTSVTNEIRQAGPKV